MADVFISYASEDRDRVRKLAAALEKRGLSVWWDRALAGGQDYAAVIERQIENAHAVVVVWSEASTASTFVRDEAARAREGDRFIPILFDNVEIPLGFGAFHTEDFTRWNGAANAPQMQILDEIIRAMVMGRKADTDLIARKRRRMMTNIRVVTLLTVVFLIAGIAVFGKQLVEGPPPPDPRTQLLTLLEEGKLSPDEAIRLAEVLSNEAVPAPVQGDQAPAANAARESFEEAATQLVQNAALPAQVRRAIGEMGADETRDAAMDTLWRYAGEADEPTQALIYQLCGAVAEAHQDELAERALDRALALAPENPRNWQMAATHYARTDRAALADAANAVSEGITADAAGDKAGAEAKLQSALPAMTASATRAFVASELGELAGARGDWTAASARYALAYRARAEAAAGAPGSRAATLLQNDAVAYVSALDQSGRVREACTQLQRAQVEYDVATPAGDLGARCQALNIQLRAG